jgi:hypothetical protein
VAWRLVTAPCGALELSGGWRGCGVHRVNSLDKQVKQLGKEKELIEKKMARIEAAKAAETSELRGKLEAAQADVRMQLKERDTKISTLVDELATTTALYNEAKGELDQVLARAGGTGSCGASGGERDAAIPATGCWLRSVCLLEGISEWHICIICINGTCPSSQTVGGSIRLVAASWLAEGTCVTAASGAETQCCLLKGPAS